MQFRELMGKRSARAGAISLLAGFVSVGCDDGRAVTSNEPPAPRAPAEAIPERVGVAATEAEMGTLLGTHRSTVKVEAFEITRFPVTNRQYQQCVDAGACAPAAFPGASCASEQLTGLAEPDVPVSCLAPEQASGYCSWVGGRLPTVDEWTLAARGRAVRRYAWGNSEPSCEQHWQGARARPEQPCSAQSRSIAVGQHAQGKSPSGLEDVLTFEAEMIGISASAEWFGCREGRACVAAGIRIGAIDSYEGIAAADGGVEDRRSRRASFRCAWQGGR
jgi:formylglycine-generating enzyme required for sulfatase activity